MSNISGVGARKAVHLLTEVAESIKKQEQGISKGHTYLKVDTKSQKLVATQGSKDKVSFKQISEIFQQVLANKDLSSTEKHKALEAYKIITKKYEMKETGFFTKYFGSAVEKEKEVQHANTLIHRAEVSIDKKAKQEIIDLKNCLDDFQKLGTNPPDDDVKKFMWTLRHKHWDAIDKLDWPTSEKKNFKHASFSRLIKHGEMLEGLKPGEKDLLIKEFGDNKEKFQCIFFSLDKCLATNYAPDGAHKVDQSKQKQKSRTVHQHPTMTTSSLASKQREVVSGLKEILDSSSIDFDHQEYEDIYYRDGLRDTMFNLSAFLNQNVDEKTFRGKDNSMMECKEKLNAWFYADRYSFKPEDRKEAYLAIQNLKKDLDENYESNGKLIKQAHKKHIPQASRRNIQRQETSPLQTTIITERAKKQRRDISELKNYFEGQYAQLGNKPKDFNKDGEVLINLMRNIKIVYPQVTQNLYLKNTEKKKLQEALEIEGSHRGYNTLLNRDTIKYSQDEQKKVLEAIQILKKHLDKFDSTGQLI